MSTPTRELKAAPFYQEHLPTRVLHHGDGCMKMEIDFTDLHLNAAGVVHGGVIAALLDVASAGGGSATSTDAERAYGVTMSLTVNFIKGAVAGPAKIEGVAIGGGRKTKFVEGKMHDSTGSLVATSTSTVKVIDLAKS